MKRHLPKLVAIAVAAVLCVVAAQPWAESVRDYLLGLAGFAVGKELMAQSGAGR